MHHDLATTSLIGPDKNRCGDHVVVVDLPARDAVVLVVCDGVGSHSHDWLASATACDAIAKYLPTASGDLDAALMDAVSSAHEAVQALTGPAAGASTTLVLVCWTLGADVARCISIGDSRLYRVQPAAITQLTEDDSASVPVRIAGELALSGGSVAFAQGLTRAVGYGILGHVAVDEVPILEGEMLAATSDGFHEIPGFLRALEAVYTATDLDRAIAAELGSLHAGSGRDDGTIAVLRRSGVTASLRARCRAGFQSESPGDNLEGVPAHLLRQALLGLVAAALAAGDPADARCGLDLLAARGLPLSRDQLTGLLDGFRDDGSAVARDVYRRLVQMAKRAR